MERITPVYTELADSNFDGGQGPAGLKPTIPAEVCKYIAIAVGGCNRYGGLVHLVAAHLVDPLAGLAGGYIQPGLSGLTDDDGNGDRTRNPVKGGSRALGYDVTVWCCMGAAGGARCSAHTQTVSGTVAPCLRGP